MTAEQSLVNDVAWMPMEQVTAFFLVKPCVVGYVVDHQDLTPPNDWGWYLHLDGLTVCYHLVSTNDS